MMGRLGAVEGLMLLGVLAFWLVVLVVPFWQIFRKAGFPAALSLLMLVPVVQIVVLFYVAFARWPALNRRGGA